jgi:hypothetical protein
MKFLIGLNIIFVVVVYVFYLIAKAVEKVESRKKEKEWVRKRCLKSN